MGILISQTVDPEELIKQYNWLCEQSSMAYLNTPEGGVASVPTTRVEVIGLQNLLESMMMRMWGSVSVYQQEEKPLYLVIMPDGTTTYFMEHNEYGTFFACYEGPAEGDLTWTRLGNGDMVPAAFPKEVSIISVEPVIREHILKCISEDAGYYDQYLEPTT